MDKEKERIFFGYQPVWPSLHNTALSLGVASRSLTENDFRNLLRACWHGHVLLLRVYVTKVASNPQESRLALCL